MESGDDRRTGQFNMAAVSEIVGREECVNSLLHRLIPQDGQENDDLRVLSIVDRGAMGKTALARSVYDKLDVKRWFAYRAWVQVQDNFSVADVLVDILRQISTSEMRNIDRADEDGLSFKLNEYFFKQRYLVVLDNINSDDLIVKLLMFLMDSSNGSRVIITTRNDNLPDLVDPWVDPINFHPLTEEDRKGLLLLCSNEIEPNEHLMQRISSWSSLSPAGIRLLGGLFSVRPDSRQFEEKIGRLGEHPSLVDIVSLCYDDLPRSLQNCIMYICRFPREYEIPTRRLLRLWLAESLVLESQRSIQDAEKWFQELVRRNMTHVVSRYKGYGFAKTCRMPGFIYDFLLQKALQTGLFEIYGNGSSTNNANGEPKFMAPRIVVDNPSIHEKLGGSSEMREQFNRTQYNVKQLRSYASFNTKKIIMRKRELDVILNPKGKKSSLEVLDLEGVYKPLLPKNLGYVLLNLKYLGLRWTILDELPKSVGNLPCLETLDVKHTNITKLSSSIWTKKSLRHLYLNEVNVDKSNPPRWWRLSPSSKLPNSLQTLCGLHIEEGKSPMLEALRKLTGITKLSLTCSSTVVREVMEHIKGLTTLQSLKLKAKDLLGQPSKLLVDDMNGLVSLSNLYLFGDLRDNNLSFLPNNLRSLTLSMSSVASDTMDVLARLECLTDLRLYAFSYDGTTLSCAIGTFPHLRVLKLFKLSNLESLIVAKQAMPCLEELDIRDCQKLRKIEVLGYRKALKEVSLAKVKKELAKSLEASIGPSVIITTELIAYATASEG